MQKLLVDFKIIINKSKRKRFVQKSVVWPLQLYAKPSRTL